MEEAGPARDVRRSFLLGTVLDLLQLGPHFLVVFQIGFLRNRLSVNSKTLAHALDVGRSVQSYESTGYFGSYPFSAHAYAALLPRNCTYSPFPSIRSHGRTSFGKCPDSAAANSTASPGMLANG